MLRTPSELIEIYPEVKTKFNWSADTIGIFLAGGLVRGVQNRTKKCSLIYEDSFKKLIAFTNQTIASQMIEV